jgi:hypothetical protein
MAFSLLDEGSTDTDAQDYTNVTASISPTAGRLVLAMFQVLELGGEVAQDPTSVTGCGLTWERVETVGTSQNRQTVWRAYADPGSVTSGSLSVNDVVASGTADGIAWMVVEMDAADASVSNGANSIVQTAEENINADSATATLAAFSHASNYTIAFFACYDNAGAGSMTASGGSGFTTLGTGARKTYGGDDTIVMFQYKTSPDTGVDCSASSANDRIQLLAMELKTSQVQTPAVLAATVAAPAATLPATVPATLTAAVAALSTAGATVGAVPAVTTVVVALPEATPDGGSAEGATVEPATIAASVSLSVPTVSVEAVTNAIAVIASVLLPSIGTTHFGAVIEATTSLAAAQQHVGASSDPIALVAATPQATVSVEATPAVVAAAVLLAAATVGATVTPTTTGITVVFPEASAATSNIVVTPGVIEIGGVVINVVIED